MRDSDDGNDKFCGKSGDGCCGIDNGVSAEGTKLNPPQDSFTIIKLQFALEIHFFFS
jgi:hypothetical protein